MRPSGKDDIQDTDDIQVLPFNIVGDWNFDGEKPVFIVKNETDIQHFFKEISQLFDLNV